MANDPVSIEQLPPTADGELTTDDLIPILDNPGGGGGITRHASIAQLIALVEVGASPATTAVAVTVDDSAFSVVTGSTVQAALASIDALLGSASGGGGGRTVHTITADYTLATTDATQLVQANSSGPIIITVPNDASDNIPLTSLIPVQQIGTGPVYIAAAAGVTINGGDPLYVLNGQFSQVELRKNAANTWALTGQFTVSSSASSAFTPLTLTFTPVDTLGSSSGGGGGPLPYGLSSTTSDYGVPAGLPARSAYAGSTTISTPGTTISNKIITGGIYVNAAGVTFDNCEFLCGSGMVDSALLYYAGGSPNLTVQNCDFDGTYAGVVGCYQAIHGWSDGLHVIHCTITKVANGIEFGGSGTVEWCYLYNIWQCPGTSQHADGIQTDGGGPYTVRYNYVAMGSPPSGYWTQTSAIGMWADLASLHDVLVEYNVLDHFGGFIFYNGITNGEPFTVTNCRFNNNVILVAPSGAEYGIWYGPPSNPMRGTTSGNVLADGTPV